MAPRTITMNKLVEKYHLEQLKGKVIAGLKINWQRKKNEANFQAEISHDKKLKYFKCWLMLYNERNIANNLRTPFVNLQKQAYDENWSLSKLNMNTEKVYSYLSIGKKRHILNCWRVWTQKKKLLTQNVGIIQKIQNDRIKKVYFSILVDTVYERRQERMVESYMVSLNQIIFRIN